MLILHPLEKNVPPSLRCGSAGMLQWMVDYGAVDLEKENDSGYECGNLLISAAYWGNVDSIRLLLGVGANVNAAVQSGRYGSALVAAVANIFNEHAMKTAKLLLDSGADPNLPLRGGEYGSALEALALTCDGKHDEEFCIRLWLMLVDVGADPTTVFDRGEHGSALAAAAFYGHKDLLKAMIDHVGTEKAIDTLRQSRHPNKREFGNQQDVERWKGTTAYLANEVGASKDVLVCVGLWDVEPVRIRDEDWGDRFEIRYIEHRQENDSSASDYSSDGLNCNEEMV